MNVLLTRPQTESEALGERLRGLGHDVILSPVITIDALETIPARLDCEAVIATSARAFAHAYRSGAERNWQQAKLFCAGQRTAAAAMQYGFPAPQVVTPVARELAAVITANIAAPARLIYLAGNDRKPFLETDLNAARYDVQVIPVYSAQAAETLTNSAITALRAGKIDAVMHFSRRSAAIFAQLAIAAGVAEQAAACRHVCISADAAKGLDALPAVAIEIAATPDTDAILARLNMIAN